MGYRALIIEDDYAIADVLTMKLTREGHHVSVARHQKDAYRMLDQNTFDFALLDLRLPTNENDMDPNTEVGFAILDHIRGRFPLDKLPVIVMTAYEETSQTAVRALKAFANDYIQKPFEDSPVSLDEKIAVITRFLQRTENSSAGIGYHSPDRRHKIIFGKGYVEINGIKITRSYHKLLYVLGSNNLMLTPGERSRNGFAMPGSQIANALNIEEATVRQYIRRFRKYIADEHQRLNKGIIGDQDIIRNNRNWKGYEINFEMSYIAIE